MQASRLPPSYRHGARSRIDRGFGFAAAGYSAAMLSRERLSEDAGRELAPSRIRLGVAAGVGVLAGVVVGLAVRTPVAVLAGWDTLAAIYIGWASAGTWRLDSAATARLARREDPGRAVTDVLLLAASLASLGGVGLVVIASRSQSASAKDLSAALAVLSVVMSWGLVHTVYTERYVRAYHSAPVGGIDFNEPDPPRFLDFAYVAFTVGMTFQVSDTDVTGKSIRSLVLRHALLSYLFGAVIIAATINLLAGLAR